ncbi:hypothetical protein B0H10DRAFT_1969678 [Mycena sp. CBHHK59/15]|nr:hypothetical protein B0H10DRAFT_1969678 [Mycena sp. CBHHK59/15]
MCPTLYKHVVPAGLRRSMAKFTTPGQSVYSSDCVLLRDIHTLSTCSKHGHDDSEAETSEAPTSKIPQEDWDLVHDHALGTSRSAIYRNKNGLTKKGKDKIGQQGITTFFTKKPLPPLPIAEISCQTQIPVADIDSDIEIIDQPDDDTGPPLLVLDHELFSEYSEMHVEVNVPKTAIPAALHIDEQMSWMDSNLAAEPQSSIPLLRKPMNLMVSQIHWTPKTRKFRKHRGLLSRQRTFTCA